MRTLLTKRLMLRPINMGDLDDIHEIFGDPEAMRYYPSTRTRDELVPLVEKSLHFTSQTAIGAGFLEERPSFFRGELDRLDGRLLDGWGRGW